jgi:hypothetical protein
MAHKWINFREMPTGLLLDTLEQAYLEKGILIADSASVEETSQPQSRIDAIRLELERRLSW